MIGCYHAKPRERGPFFGPWHFQPQVPPNCQASWRPRNGFFGTGFGLVEACVTEKRIDKIPMAQDWCLRQQKICLVFGRS